MRKPFLEKVIAAEPQVLRARDYEYFAAYFDTPGYAPCYHIFRRPLDNPNPGAWKCVTKVCQEKQEENTSTQELPPMCYAVNGVTGQVIILKRGESGYYSTTIQTGSPEESEIYANAYNKRLGVTRAQREAMYVGSLMGYDAPGADPKMYNALGQPKQLCVRCGNKIQGEFFRGESGFICKKCLKDMQVFRALSEMQLIERMEVAE